MYHKICLQKDYDQFQYKDVQSNPFLIEIQDYSELIATSNLRVFMEIWSEEDETYKKTVQVLRDVNFPKEARYICRIPFDDIEDTIYCFKIKIRDRNNKTLIASVKQTIRPVPIDIDEEEVQQNPNFDLVQGMLNSITEASSTIQNLNNQVIDYIAQADVNSEVYKYIDSRIDSGQGYLIERSTEAIKDIVIEELDDILNTKKQELIVENGIVLDEKINDLALVNDGLLTTKVEDLKVISSEILDGKKQELEQSMIDMLTRLDDILGQITGELDE